LRVAALHQDAIVLTSRLWQTNAVALRRGEEAMLIDSPYFPDELDVLPQVMAQAGFQIVGLLATHADWDHLLGRYAYPSASLGLGQPSMERMRAEPGKAQLALREADAEHYVTRPGPLSLGQAQSLPVPGKLDLGDAEIELHLADGHTSDGTAYFARQTGVLVCGDYLSDVEIPMISPGGSLDAYRGTLARLAPLLEEAERVVPGHGAAHERDAALRLLDEDLGYLDVLERGEEKPRLPRGRDTTHQRSIHARNLQEVVLAR
jgi:glyoxylase-like metal-dependent hydrolase (beta-lactamase superfamily II)